jgi:site-specific DNA recombinase
MTVGIYIRVSTQEQATEGYSIPAQKERLITYCKAQGWDDYKLYIDEGVSAKDTDRPQLSLLLEHVKAEQINMILVYRLDRFTRSVRDLYNLLETLEKHKCSFKSQTEIYDTSSAIGRMFIGLVALLAQWETENLSERIKMALNKKVSGGERVGNIPYGFDLDENERLIKNDKSLIVLDMIDKIKKGMSTNQLVKHLNETNNDRTWHVNGVLRILKNPVLYGATRWVDDIFEDTHEGIITKHEFDKLQKLLDDRSLHHKREVESIYLFQGIIACFRCEKPLTVNRFVRTKKDGSIKQGAVYKCQSCYKEGKPMETIGEQRFLDALKSYMENVEITHIEPVVDNTIDERTSLLKQIEQIEKKRQKYQRGWAADLINDEEFEQRMNETKGIYEELKTKLSEMKAPEAPIDIEAIKQIMFMFNQSFSFLTQTEKRMFISQFIRTIKFQLVPQPPKRPSRSKKGKDLVVITDVEFY